MRRIGRDLVYSPSDLTEFMESRFASFMTRLALEEPDVIRRLEESLGEKPAAASAASGLRSVDEILKEHGFRHEADVLQALRDEGCDVAEISDSRADRVSLDETLQALRDGREIVFQAQLAHGSFAGVADFLVKVDGPSKLGAHAYEVWDAKLARRAKPYFLVQLCAYARMLEALQGHRPEHVRVVLGSGERRGFRTDDFFYFYASLERAFLAFMADFDPARPPLPEPGADHRRWQAHADRLLEQRDHVSRVARITRSQVFRLADHGIETLGQLANLAGTEHAGVPRVQPQTLERLTDQAALQRDSVGLATPRHHVLRPEADDPRRGLALLPPPSPLDVFFDIEGYPLVDGGLEYLWGAVTTETGAPVYRDWWAHDPVQEKRAFESFVDFVFERRQRDPALHVYHYAPYEVTALRKLMGAYGTREEQVDDLLRGEVFVDLYAVVRGGVRVGEPAYSIKNLERLYRGGRDAEVATGMDSVAWYEAWRASGEPQDAAASPWLREIRAYNEEDCVSTLQLVDWLRERQREHDVPWLAKEGADEPAPVEKTPAAEAQREMAERLLAGIPDDPAERSQDRERWRIQELLAHLVEFHQREMRPVYWALHDRCDRTEDERAQDLDCLAGLERTSAPPQAIKRSQVFEYAFAPGQDTKIREGDKCRIAQARTATVEVTDIDLDAARVSVKVGSGTLQRLGWDALPERLCLVLHTHVGADAIAASILEVARSWLDDGALPSALDDFLRRAPPRVVGQPRGAPLVHSDEAAGSAVARLAKGLAGSALSVQGPPGSGKTSRAAEAILALLAEGRNVGISSNSHSAILHLMRACAERSRGLACLKVGGDKEDGFFGEFPGAQFVAQAQQVVPRLDSHRLVGGTAWVFSNPVLGGAFDTLFIDEAGQVSIANLVGMSRSARNLVLVGDQMQLPQPLQGAHPGESGASILDYQLGRHAVVPPELGVFLDRTWRLHPSLCRFISGAVYEGRLEPDPDNARRVVRVPEHERGARHPGAGHVRSEAGLVFVPVEHQGNAQASDEEVARIVEIVGELEGRERTDRSGAVVGRIALQDILFVAPYNLQVRKLQEALGERARVGSVDRFQGLEAPVVVVSLCASDAGEAPRGIDFLLDRHRLNVAISRAQSLAIVVGSPALARVDCTSIQQMELVNLFCRICEEGDPA